MPAKPISPAPDSPPSYEAAASELDTLIAAMEAGQLPLDALLAQYQRGVALLAVCRERLAAVEEQVQVYEQGQARTWEGA